MKPKQRLGPTRRHRVQSLAIALGILSLLTLAHGWLIGRANQSVGRAEAGSAAPGDGSRPAQSGTAATAVDIPDFQEGKGLVGVVDRLRRHLVGRRHRSSNSTTTTTASRHPGLAPPPRPFGSPPTYDPELVRPKRRGKPTLVPTLSPSVTPEIVRDRAPGGGGDAAEEEDDDREATGVSSAGVDFFSALNAFYENLLIEDVKGNPDQPPRSFTDINGTNGKGVALPYDPSFVEEDANWQACDARDASFTAARDSRCQAYLRNLNNMRFIRAMPSRLLQGRTIKMKIRYAHNNIEAIVKIAQRDFTYEAVSEYLAFTYDRALQFHRVPPTMYVALPLDYLRAATSYSPLLSQWFHRAVVLYNYTNANFEPCSYPRSERRGEVAEDDGGQVRCAMVSTQLWMKDVHPATETFLGLNFDFDEAFARKYYIPGHESFVGTKRARLRAIGELLDRFIFDFIIGNTDRGMNDHNNFVYGGCSRLTECRLRKPEHRIKGLAKYAFLDQGSSFHSHKELQDNPFFGSSDKIKICRYRRSTSDNLRRLVSQPRQHTPLYTMVEKRLPTSVFKVAHESVLRKTQVRLDKLVGLIEGCLKTYPEEIVFSLPEYDQVRIAEEDDTLGDEWD